MRKEEEIAPANQFSLREVMAQNKLMSFAALAMFAIIIVVGSLCFKNALAWVDKPFPGFLVNERVVVNVIGQYYWNGIQAGLISPDKIVEANQRAVRSARDLEDVVRGVRLGDPVTYLIERDGQFREVSVKTSRFTWADLFLTFGPPFSAGILYLFIGLLVYILKPQTRVSQLFLLSCFFLSFASITMFDVASNHQYIRVYYLAFTFAPAAFSHFSLHFPETRPFVPRQPKVQGIPYLVSLFLAIPMQALYPRASHFAFFKLVTLYFFIAACMILYPILAAYWKPTSVIGRQRAKVVLLGAALAFPLPALAIGSQAIFGSFFGMWIEGNLLTPFLMIFPASIAYAIAKHNLFDVDVYIKRTVGYVLMTGVVALTYFLVQTVFSTFLLRPVFGAHAESLYPIFFALLVVFFFNPVNRWIQDGVERLFFRKPYDYKATVASVGDALTSLLNLDAIVTKVLYTLRERMFLDKAAMILLDPGKKECHSLVMDDVPGTVQGASQGLCLYSDDPLLALLNQEKKLITKYDIAEEPRYAAVREPCGKTFSNLGASLAIPLLHQNTLTGVLALGYKKSGHFYSRDDIDLLKTISTMTATAIEQAREKEQRGVLMQLFSKHVSPQVAEALWRERDQFLDGGRPRSQKLMVTVMFTDLEGFSTVSEKFEPEILMGWLNTYMEVITNTVMAHQGVVDDYFGDGVKVNFGVPLPRLSETAIRQDAINAVQCALALEREMVRLNVEMKERGLPTLRMRIGINTGPVVAGSLGSADRMKYTTLGDTVNTAARLEAFSKEIALPPAVSAGPCRILVSESTVRHLGDQFRTEKVGELALKGKEQTIPTYCVMGRAPEASPTELPAERTRTG